MDSIFSMKFGFTSGYLPRAVGFTNLMFDAAPGSLGEARFVTCDEIRETAQKPYCLAKVGGVTSTDWMVQ